MNGVFSQWSGKARLAKKKEKTEAVISLRVCSLHNKLKVVTFCHQLCSYSTVMGGDWRATVVSI